MKHTAMLTGLGTIGKNLASINEAFGDMIWLSAALTTLDLEPDPLADYEVCPLLQS